MDKISIKLFDLSLKELSTYVKYVLGGVGITGLLYFLKKKLA